MFQILVPPAVARLEAGAGDGVGPEWRAANWSETTSVVGWKTKPDAAGISADVSAFETSVLLEVNSFSKLLLIKQLWTV